MMNLTEWMRAAVRSNPATRRLAPLIARATPDLALTRDIPYLGRFCFGLRSHRWMLDRNPLAPHRTPLAMFDRLLSPDAVVYDVGANIGYYTRFFLRHYAGSQVVCFEPMTGNLRILRRNLAPPEYADRTKLFEIALNDHPGVGSLQIDDICGGTAVLDEISGGEPAAGRAAVGLGPKQETVALRMLDEVIAAETLAPPTMVKVDTEGAELSVLKGATTLLHTHHPHLCLALHGTSYGDEMADLLDSFGYVSYGFMPDGIGKSVYRRLERSDFARLDDGNIACSVNEDLLRGPFEPLDLNRFNR